MTGCILYIYDRSDIKGAKRELVMMKRQVPNLRILSIDLYAFEDEKVLQPPVLRDSAVKTLGKLMRQRFHNVHWTLRNLRNGGIILAQA
jgi:hypothetical protein